MYYDIWQYQSYLLISTLYPTSTLSTFKIFSLSIILHSFFVMCLDVTFFSFKICHYSFINLQHSFSSHLLKYFYTFEIDLRRGTFPLYLPCPLTSLSQFPFLCFSALQFCKFICTIFKSLILCYVMSTLMSHLYNDFILHSLQFVIVFFIQKVLFVFFLNPPCHFYCF